ncbi:ABC transporter ATP-binding protein [Hyphococcus sp.]|uniref:ABC transporter ATP-binding protein n=1 Tax=Hyphococcus sp. TaxID=2038636 RepID=UPI003CCC26C2
MDKNSVLLEIEKLAVRFDTRAGAVAALSGVSFHVQPGETLAIVGESGSGKSCCALSILDLIPSPPGQRTADIMRFGDIDLLSLSGAQLRKLRGDRIAMAFQDPLSSLNPLLTIGDQIAEVLRTHRNVDAKQARRRAVELLNLVGIPDAASRLKSYPHEMSGGMRQRVMIAIALACEPELFIADEPTTALDVTVQAQIVELVKNLQRDNSMSIIWITHDLSVIAGFADRVIVLYAGNIVEESDTQTLFLSPRHPYTDGLLKSLPRIDQEPAARLSAIKGLPPDLTNLPVGCAFEPRCPRAVERCKTERPSLESHSPGHKAACWNPIIADTPEGVSRAAARNKFS